MPSYRCYLMTGEHIHAVQNLDCEHDADAILKAVALLKSRPQHQNMEIWEGKRLVARIPRGDQQSPPNIVTIGTKKNGT